jgi:hypothetical protein
MSASSGIVFDNQGTFEVQNDQAFSSACLASFTNEGIFRKTSSFGTTTIGLVFSNNGEVDIQTGTVDFSCGSGPRRSHPPLTETGPESIYVKSINNPKIGKNSYWKDFTYLAHEVEKLTRENLRGS